MSGRLTDWQLGAFQAVAASALDATCDIRRNPNLDGDGQPQSNDLGALDAPDDVTTWTLIASSVACSFSTPPQNTLGQIDSQIAQLAVWVLSLPTGTDCQVADYVVVGSAKYEVHAALSPQTYSTLDQFVIGEVR